MDALRAVRASLARVRGDWRWGRESGYPRCCIAMYCWDSLWALPPSLTRMVAQGVEAPDSTCEWVLCGVFHAGGSALSFAERVRRIALYWWATLPLVWRWELRPRGWLRPPWRPPEEPRPSESPTPVIGLLDEAPAQNPDLDWI